MPKVSVWTRSTLIDYQNQWINLGEGWICHLKCPQFLLVCTCSFLHHDMLLFSRYNASMPRSWKNVHFDQMMVPEEKLRSPNSVWVHSLGTIDMCISLHTNPFNIFSGYSLSFCMFSQRLNSTQTHRLPHIWPVPKFLAIVACLGHGNTNGSAVKFVQMTRGEN